MIDRSNNFYKDDNVYIYYFNNKYIKVINVKKLLGAGFEPTKP